MLKYPQETVAEVIAANDIVEVVGSVLDLKASVRHRLMVMENPYRVVVDAFSEGNAEPPASLDSLEGQHVVIDPGHGGKDVGATGPRKIREKAVTLAIGKQVAAQLRAAGVPLLPF